MQSEPLMQIHMSLKKPSFQVVTKKHLSLRNLKGTRYNCLSYKQKHNINQVQSQT